MTKSPKTSILTSVEVFGDFVMAIIFLGNFPLEGFAFGGKILGLSVQINK